MRAVGPAVIHLVGGLTEDVFSFLGPLTSTLSRKGIVQTVIMRDEPAFRHLHVKFNPSISLVLLPSNPGIVGRLRNMSRALTQEAKQKTVVYCHLHGVVPSLVGAWAYRVNQIGARLMFSPHGSRSLGSFKVLGAGILKLLRVAMPVEALVPVATGKLEARRIAKMSDRAVAVIETPVHDAFFAAAIREADSPTVISGAGLPDRIAAARFAQIAVLLWDESVHVTFAWYGPLDPDSRATLIAAGVVLHEILSDAERATAMAGAWAYVSLCDNQGFPSMLAAAMALGLPCVGWGPIRDSDLICNEVTGLVADDESEALDCLTRCIRSPDLRTRLGMAARRDALTRFNRDRFDMESARAQVICGSH